MKISLITTVFNEEKTIDRFLTSIFQQSKLPDEVLIVDGGSKDGTVKSIKDKLASSKYKGKFHISIKEGNRSVGRNEAIMHATGDIIACSDAGNILDKKWIERITEPFRNKNIDVVAGYYEGLAKNIFQKCLIPYALVMPDKVDSNTFLPATRSIAFTKAIWEKTGGFDERLSHNEDYAFARKLKDVGARIIFAKDAIVYWIPRNTFKEAFIMFFRFAYGDAEAEIYRPKVVFLFSRYVLGTALIIFFFIIHSHLILNSIYFIFILYILWSILKNYRYVNHWKAFYLLPLLQFTADFAVILGTITGLLNGI